MKKTDKNFIAFTLSEMMIVLLIVSVISAAILPAITTKKDVKPLNPISLWNYDNTYNKGYFYVNSKNSDPELVILGDRFPNQIAYSNFHNMFGNPTLLLARGNQMLPYTYANRSDIAFYNEKSEYTGKIGADYMGNIAIGKDVIYPNSFSAMVDPSNTAAGSKFYNNLYIGRYAGSNMVDLYASTAYPANYLNVVIGYAAASNSGLRGTNCIIGQNITSAYFNSNNTIIGKQACSNTAYATEHSISTIKGNTYNISIGAYSGSNTPYQYLGTNIGYYSGASSVNNYPGKLTYGSYMNIGYYSGYDSSFASTAYSNINIGSHAGQTRPHVLGSTINIGTYAGYYVRGGGSVNIGIYAGSPFTNIDTQNAWPTRAGVNIGNFAGAYTERCPQNTYFVNIGSYAGYGSYNESDIHIGHSAGRVTGDRNFVNYRELNNISIGYWAGADSRSQKDIYIGEYAGYKANGNVTTLKFGNIGIGHYAMYKGKGSNNVIIGCYSKDGEFGNDSSSNYKMCIGGKYPDGLSNSGWNKTNAETQTLILTPGIIGASEIAWDKTHIYLVAYHVIGFKASMTQFSDRTLKENIRKTKYGIDKLRKINIYQFNMKGHKEINIGVIAQELMKEYPNAVSEYPDKINNKKYYSVSPDWIIFSLAQSIKDVDMMVQTVQKTLKASLLSVSKLANNVNSIENRLIYLSESNKDLRQKLNEIEKEIKDVEHK